MEIRIVSFTEEKAKQFIYQKDQKTKMKQIDSAAMNQYSPANTVKAIRALNPFGEFLFMDKQGRRIRANRFNHWLHRACKKVGIPERSTHKIRKTYASILLSNKVDERLIINQMGHTDIATTRGSYYFNRNSEDKNKGIISNAIYY